MKINEAEAVNSIINLLTEHNIRKEEYLMEYNGNGNFYIKFCPKRHVTIDVIYILENIPDIKIFKIKNVKDTMYLILKIKIRA